MCRDFCSVAGATRHEADSPKHKGAFVKEVIDEKNSLDAAMVDYFYRCAMCKACREACETDLDTSELVLSARTGVKGDLIPSKLGAVRENIVSGNMYADELSDLKSLLKPHLAKGKAHTLLYFGRKLRCEGLAAITGILSLLDKLNAEYSVMETEPDTGQLAYFLGFAEDARALAETCNREIEALHPQTLVVFSADDLRMIKKEFTGPGLSQTIPVIQSVPEFLLELINKMKPAFKDTTEKVSYHDSCALGRELRVFEAPRELIRNVPGVTLVEMAFNRDQAPCCGYGMGLDITHPEIKAKMAARLRIMAMQTGATTLVTGCPVCSIVLNAAAVTDMSDQNSGGIEIIDIAQFLERRLIV
ncbi:MAG: (Fe-S)-binding protein [Spirochaetes bacterium]|nr:(Fe-S)-binding protein [Spirochaetota bacterium]